MAGEEGQGALMPAGPFGPFGELQPLACQLFILALELEIAHVGRELPALCRVGAEFFGTGLHVSHFDDLEHFPGIHRGECNNLDSSAQPLCPAMCPQ